MGQFASTSLIFDTCSAPTPDLDAYEIAINDSLLHTSSPSAKFTDLHFPPGLQSLIHDRTKLTEDQVRKWQHYEWRRLSDLYVNLVLFGPDGIPRADHVCQGSLGNCYFLSALQALAKNHPQLVKGIFVTQEVSRVGTYKVQLFVNGERQVVTVGRSHNYMAAMSTEGQLLAA